MAFFSTRKHVAPSSWRWLHRGISCPWHRSGHGSGWAWAGRCWLSRALASLAHQAAALLPVLERCWCVAVPPLCLPRARPCSDQPMAVHMRVSTAAQCRGVQPGPPQPCPLCPTAVPWVPRSSKDVATRGTGTHLKWERLGPTTAVVESHLSPSLWLEALGESVPMVPSSPCLGICLGAAIRALGTSLPWLVVGMKAALPLGLSSCPGAREAPHAGDVDACPCVGPSGPAGCSRLMAARDAKAAKRCHFLQLGFYRVGGGGAFIEPCLHFWSFLRDTFSHACPAWSHLLPGGLRGRDPLFEHFSYVACAPPAWRASGAKGQHAGG